MPFFPLSARECGCVTDSHGALVARCDDHARMASVRAQDVRGPR